MAATTPTNYHTSLLTAQDCRGHVHLIVGSNPLAATRCGQSLAAGAAPLLIAPETSDLHYGLQKRIDAGEVKWHKKAFSDDLLFTLGRAEVDHVVDAVFITSGPRDSLSVRVSALCRRHRIPVNVVDAPALCTFALLSTYADGPLQVGVTTNGRGCKLANRIRREVAAGLPTGLGQACARLGEVRRRIQEEDRLALAAGAVDDGVDDSLEQSSTFNKLVTEADADAAKTRRMRWLAQVCEYWPLKRLVALSDGDVETMLASYPGNHLPDRRQSDSDGATTTTRGRIILAGSGPGHPDLLTLATHKALQTADLVLADKLVPAAVLELIPRRTPVSIARKFPGNADAAQDELLVTALDAARSGRTVLRLKQGDPFLFGRGGEEVAFFRRHGFPAGSVVVLPGVTSSLAGPLFAGIPATMRDVADQIIVCTGTGRKGTPPKPPEYVPSRTAVFLMALHRVGGLVAELTEYLREEEAEKENGETAARLNGGDGKPNGNLHSRTMRRTLWPRSTPCAVVERASCPDQRVIRTTLEFVLEAVEQEGSRPPGLLVVGKACEALCAPEEGRPWVVEDGFTGLDLDGFVAPALDSAEDVHT